MSKLQYFIKGNNKIAYRYYKRSKKNLIFIHGLMSDMNGQKSVFFNNHCRKENISFSRDIDLLEETTEDICQSGFKLGGGLNKQEVVVVPKKQIKQGFFEKLFHFFK